MMSPERQSQARRRQSLIANQDTWLDRRGVRRSYPAGAYQEKPVTTRLHTAAARGLLREARQLLIQGVDTRAQDEQVPPNLKSLAI